jgi:hypothetical protein
LLNNRIDTAVDSSIGGILEKKESSKFKNPIATQKS